jgi:hypothetical protein
MVLLLAFLLASFPARNSDLWMHLATGRALAAGEYRFGTDLFAYTTAGADWVNHSWLFDLLAYGLYEVGGGPGLILFKAALITLLAAVLLNLGRRGGDWFVPSLCTGATLLAMGPWLTLHSVCVSYLFLALTIWLLERHRPRATLGRDLASRWPLLGLFVLWVNLDSWFVLGPLAVALYALGRGMDPSPERLGRDRPVACAPGLGPRYTLMQGALILAAGLAVLLVNPHHFRALTLPAALMPPDNEVLRTDPVFQGLYLSPWEGSYFRSGFAGGPGGVAYFLLVLAGALSFVLNGSGWRWERALLWLAFFLLSAYRARAVPFFAIVAGPITAWNVQEYLSRRATTLIPERLTAAGRRLAVLAALGLVVAAWPGWLQPRPFERRQWDVEPDPGLRETARQIGRWRRQGRLGPEARGFNFVPDVANYCAWFCPAEKGFLDSRLPLCAPVAEDFAAVRQGLTADWGQPASSGGGEDWRAVLRRRHVSHLIVYERSPLRMARALRNLFAAPREWPLLYLRGRAVVFGWRDPAGRRTARAPAVPELDLNRMAFQVDGSPPVPLHGPPRDAHSPPWWGAFLRARLGRSADQDEASVHLMHFEASRGAYRAGYLRAWQNGLVAALAPGVAADGSPLVVAADLGLRLHLAAPRQARPRPAARRSAPPLESLGLVLANGYLAGLDDGPPGVLLLAVRAARRAVAARPDDAAAHLVLGECYLWLAGTTRERLWDGLTNLRRVQAVTSFRTALALGLDASQANRAQEALAALFREMGHLDLALEHAQALLRSTRGAGPAPGESADRYADRLDRLESGVDRLAEEVRSNRELYAANSKNLRVYDRADFARRKKLGGMALEVLLASDYAAFGGPGMALELRLLLETGQADKVLRWMDPDQKKPLGADLYYRLQFQAKAVAGDYAGVDADLTTLLGGGEKRRRDKTLTTQEAMAVVIGRSVLEGRLQSTSLADAVRVTRDRQRAFRTIQEMVSSLRREADLRVLRGVLALESGRTRRARADFRKALAIWQSRAAAAAGSGLDFPARPVAQGYEELFEKSLEQRAVK